MSINQKLFTQQSTSNNPFKDSGAMVLIIFEKQEKLDDFFLALEWFNDNELILWKPQVKRHFNSEENQILFHEAKDLARKAQEKHARLITGVLKPKHATYTRHPLVPYFSLVVIVTEKGIKTIKNRFGGLSELTREELFKLIQ